MSLIDKWNKKEKNEKKDQEHKKEIPQNKAQKAKSRTRITKRSSKSKSFIIQELEDLAKTSDFKRVIYRAILGESQRSTIDKLETDLTKYRKMIELLKEHNIDYEELGKLLESQK
jgi:predicted nucleotide-binding protein